MHQYATHRQVTKTRKDTSHTFHLLMSIFTFSGWFWLVWLPLILWHKFGPRRKVVTRVRVPVALPPAPVAHWVSDPRGIGRPMPCACAFGQNHVGGQR